MFAARPLEGNGLAVVHDADELDDETMLALARETRQSETTFVQRAGVRGADYRNRIFTLAGELPFAGHPSLGTAVAVARRRGEAQVRYVQQTLAGLQPVEVRLEGDRAHASMLQEPAELGRELAASSVLAAAGLRSDDADPGRPPQPVSTGIRHLIAPVASPDALDRAVADPSALAALSNEHGTVVLYLVHCSDGPSAHARGFFLDHQGGVLEDPATGSAAGPLLAYLHARDGRDQLRVHQGVQMGRPSVLEVRLDRDSGRVWVSGSVIAVMDATLTLTQM